MCVVRVYDRSEGAASRETRPLFSMKNTLYPKVPIVGIKVNVKPNDLRCGATKYPLVNVMRPITKVAAISGRTFSRSSGRYVARTNCPPTLSTSCSIVLLRIWVVREA